MTRLKTVVLAALTVVGFSMSSCTCQRDQPPVPTGDTQIFKERDGGIAQKSPTPKQVAAATPTPPQVAAVEATPELPQDFPSDVPVYGDAKLDQVQDLPNNAHNVIFRTAGTVNEVNRFYHEKLSAAGWDVTQQFERENHAFMTYKKGNLIANITIAEDSRTPGQQVIAVMYEEEAPLPFDPF